MKMKIPNDLRTEKHPFRQVSVTSFIISALMVIFALILLLNVKSDFKTGYTYLGLEKLSAAIAFITVGVISFWRALQYEYGFDLEEIYDPAHGGRINYLLGQRAREHKNIADEYAEILHSGAYSLSAVEKADLKDWQVLFYKLVSKKNISKFFDHFPFPITQFIANQSKPVSLLGSMLAVLFIFLFFTYLEIFPVGITWINLFILVGLLTLSRPESIDTLLERNRKMEIRNRIILFIVFFTLTIFFFKPYAGSINFGLFFFILVVGGIMVFTALLAFRLIEKVYGDREVVNVTSSSMGRSSHRAFTQPVQILQQFENTMLNQTGWYFKEATKHSTGTLAGDQNRKGEFKFEYLYETMPKILPSPVDPETDIMIKRVWRIGTALICAGITLIFISVIATPGIDAELVKNEPSSALVAYSPKVLLCLFLVLLGIAINSFGKKLVYEIYLFLQTEVFFESNLILFNCAGNYDEYEQKGDGLKRKDTATDFTVDIKVCKVVSSVFMHPKLDKKDLARQERFIVKLSEDHLLLSEILNQYAGKLSDYMTPLAIDAMRNQISNYERTKQIRSQN